MVTQGTRVGSEKVMQADGSVFPRATSPKQVSCGSGLRSSWLLLPHHCVCFSFAWAPRCLLVGSLADAPPNIQHGARKAVVLWVMSRP